MKNDAGQGFRFLYGGALSVLAAGPACAQAVSPASIEAPVTADRMANDGQATPLPAAGIAAGATDGAAGSGRNSETDIVVTGFRDSLDRSLRDKRDATNVVDTVRAEDIGKFPAQNIAEALQRVPGVSIVRDRGEGVFVRIRGLGASFEVVTLNGRTIAVNENVRDGGTTGRQFRFDTLASELVSAVEVVKSPKASLDEGGIAGIVNLRTFRPLDFKQPTLALSATASYPELPDRVNPRLSGLGSWRNADGTFGVLASAVYDERSVRQDRVILAGWTDGRIDADGNGVLDPGTILIPQSNRPTLEREQRDRLALTGAVQWKPDDRFQFTVDALWSRLNINYDELAYSADFQNTTPRAIVPGTAVVENGVLTAATVAANTQIGREISDLRYSQFALGANGTYSDGDWTVSGDVVYSRASSATENPIVRSRLLGPVGNVAFRYPRAGDGLPDLAFLAADLNSPALLPGRRIEYRVNESRDGERAAKVDVARILGETGLTALRAGAKIQSRERDYTRRDLTLLAGIAGRRFPAEAFNPFPVNGFLGEVRGDVPRSWLEPDPAYFLGASTDLAQQLAAPPTRGDLRNSFRIREEIKAGYALGEFVIPLGGIRLRGDLGLRYAATEQTSSGFLDNGTVARPVRLGRDYGSWLPAFNLVAEFGGKVQAHLAASKVITRPALADIAPRLSTATNTTLTAAGGNPDLRPFEAWQYDATAEWYFAPSSALIAGGFYKNITTFVFAQTRPFVLDGTTYLLTAPTNGGDAYVYGAEIAYQQAFRFLPAPFDGLGALATYTHTESRGTYATAAGTVFRDDLVDVAKDSFSTTLYYERNGAAARFTYSWRGNVLRDVGGAGLAANNDRPFGSLDFDISHDLTPQVTLSFQGINLTDAVQYNFVRDNRFAGYTRYGQTFLFGLRGRF